MEIGNLSNRAYYNFQTGAAAKSKSAFATTIEAKENKVSGDPLGYYYKLCEEFPNISFRLDDREMALKDTSKIHLGYNGSMNQVGNNFGGIGQCSINLDVSIIRNMQKDPEYAEKVRGYLKFIERTYPERENDTRQLGMMYTTANLWDEGGEFRTSYTMSHQQPSTEEEIRHMWNMDGSVNQIQRLFTRMQQEALDRFLEMTNPNANDNK